MSKLFENLGLLKVGLEVNQVKQWTDAIGGRMYFWSPLLYKLTLNIYYPLHLLLISG